MSQEDTAGQDDTAGQEDTAAEQGRAALRRWKNAQPTNFFQADRGLRRGLRRLFGAARYHALKGRMDDHGRRCAVELDPKVVELERQGRQPELERWDAVGDRIESVAFDARYHEVGAGLYGSGVIQVLGEPGSVTLSGTLLYLSNQLGEAGHNCPIVCTAGLVRALQHAGSEALKARYLPGLLRTDYPGRLHGAQFMTEVQGGSDVGANSVVATPGEVEGEWRIDGEKWFCSNCTADLMLATARVAPEGTGTRGLSLFLIPRHRPDGRLNAFKIRRLKEKLGTRAMPSGEIDFEGALGYNLGPVEAGFKTMMTHVISTSRLYNASGTLGMARRALTVAGTFAQHRGAFGAEIIHYPLVQETLADMRSEMEVLLCGHLHLMSIRDRLDLGTATKGDEGFFRVALNLNKYRTSVSAGEIIRGGIELLAGNGTIESFSVLPRLLRDNVVYENWEGTHNTLFMQILRDIVRLGVGTDFVGRLAVRFERLKGGAAEEFAALAVSELDALARALEALKETEPALASLQMRALCERMSSLMAACAAAEQAAWDQERDGDETLMPLVAHFWRRHLSAPLALPDADYLAGLCRLSQPTEGQ